MFEFNVKRVIIALYLLSVVQIFKTAAVTPTAHKPPAHTFTSVLDPKIVGGEPISITQAPWQVSVRLTEYETMRWGYGHICGGSVISTRVVITAAHCVAIPDHSPIVYRAPSEFTLVMGSVNLYVPSALTLQFHVLDITPHPKFNIKTLENDVALMFMNGAIPVGFPTVTPIALNTVPEPSGMMCNISGWGTLYSNGPVATLLMGASVPIVSTQVCDTNYHNITAGMLCAGYMQSGGVDACQGDSGGPLVCNNNLAGVISWGNKCAKAGYPGVYTNVSYYNSWITYTNASYDYYYFWNKGNETCTRVNLFISLLALLISIFLL